MTMPNPIEPNYAPQGSVPSQPTAGLSLQTGSRKASRKVSHWGFVLRVLFFLSGLAIGGQTALLMLRDGGAHVPLILAQAAIATLITIAGFVLLLKLTAGEPEQADPWLLQVIERESRPSVLVDQGGKLLFANAAYVALAKGLTGGEVVPPAFLLATHADYAAAAYRLAEALRQGHALSETVTLPPHLLRADHHGRLSLSVQPIVGGDGVPVVGLWQLAELADQPAASRPPMCWIRHRSAICRWPPMAVSCRSMRLWRIGSIGIWHYFSRVSGPCRICLQAIAAPCWPR